MSANLPDKLAVPQLCGDMTTLVAGKSVAFQRLLRMAERIAPTDKTLLICGPTGAGKDVIAKLVHHLHNGDREPFVDINCGAIPEHLMEAELFGHAKGAFTGASGDRLGQMSLAGRGTLFLDEVGELPMPLQPKLLRVLETRSFRPLGSSETRRFEGRIIAATHRDLPTLVRENKFREDLYYRLAVFILEVPGLEQRREDIPDLIAYFAAMQPRPLSFTADAIDSACRHRWSGNVRQLRSLVDRLGVFAEHPLVDAETLHPYLPEAPLPTTDANALADALLRLEGDDKLATAERLLIDRALQLADGNKSAAAKLLGVGRKVIERRVLVREDWGSTMKRLLDTGRRQIELGDFRAAVRTLEPGLAMMRRTPPQADTRRLNFDLLHMLGICYRGIQGWLSEEAQAYYEAALEVGHDLDDNADILSILFGIWSTQLMMLNLGKARATAQQMLQRAQTTGHTGALEDAHLGLANTLFWLGDSEEALACLARGGLLSRDREEKIGSQGFDLTELAVTLEGLAAYQCGEFPRARAAWEALARRGKAEDGHPFNRVIALQGAAWLACLFDDMEQLGMLAGMLESLSREHGFTFYQGIGELFHGYYLGSKRDFETAEHAMRDGYESRMLRNGGKLFQSFQAWKRGELLLRAGHPTKSEALVSQAIDIALAHQERAYLSELLDIRARALLAQGDRAGAEQGLRSALSTALALGSVPARIKAATHLAQLLLASKQNSLASEVLAQALRGLAPETAGYPALERAASLFNDLRTDGAQVPPQKGGIHHGL